MENRILQLKKELQALLEFKKAYETTQIYWPLDAISKKIVAKDILVSTGTFGADIIPNTFMEVNIDGILYWLLIK